MNPAERRNALLFAVGAPVVGLLLAGGANLATAVGPATLVDNWAGRALLTILGLAGYGLVLFTQLRYFNLIVFFGAFFTFFIGLTMITNVIEEHALQARGLPSRVRCFTSIDAWRLGPTARDTPPTASSTTTSWTA